MHIAVAMLANGGPRRANERAVALSGMREPSQKMQRPRGGDKDRENPASLTCKIKLFMSQCDSFRSIAVQSQSRHS